MMDHCLSLFHDQHDTSYQSEMKFSEQVFIFVSFSSILSVVGEAMIYSVLITGQFIVPFHIQPI